MRMSLKLFEWRSESDAVTVFIYESDPDKGFGALSGRAHDPVYCVLIERANTLSPYTVGDTHRPAHDDALRNCWGRGMTWHREVWSYGLTTGIPGVFVQFETTGQRRWSSATAKVKSVWVDHNFYQGGQKGMRIHCRFEVDSMTGYPGRVSAYFSYRGGEALKDFDKRYKTTGGDVSCGEDFTPRYDNSIFKDFKMFMPYSQLHMARGRHDLEFDIVIWDYSAGTGREIGRSSTIYFEYSSR